MFAIYWVIRLLYTARIQALWPAISRKERLLGNAILFTAGFLR